MPTAELAALHATLASADDAKIPKLLKIVDAVQRRGATDELLAPFRTRMGQLRPARPLRFTRLLYLPLNPLIVPSATWQAKAPALPRGTLVPMATALRAVMAEHAAAIDAIIAGRTTHDRRVIAEAGPMLWTAAADRLPQAAAPANWAQQTGLPDALFRVISDNAAAAFGAVLAIQTWRAEAETGAAVRTGAMRNMLLELNRQRPEAMSVVVALVLARLPQAVGALRRAVSEIGGGVAMTMRAALEVAAVNLVERLEAPGGIETAVLATHLQDAGAEVRRLVRLMACVGGNDASGSWRRRITSLRQRLDASCRLRFTVGLQADFLRILEDPASHPDAALLNRLEEAARGLRELAGEARLVGSDALYAELLRETTQAIKAVGVNGNFTMADKVRLVELLAGPDEAWALLDVPA